MRKIGTERESNASTNVDILTKNKYPCFSSFFYFWEFSVVQNCLNYFFGQPCFFIVLQKLNWKLILGHFLFVTLKDFGSFFHLMHHFISLS